MTHQHTTQETHHEQHPPHAVPLGLLAGVFVLLLILTLLTWAVTLVDFGYELNLAVAMVIALVKAVFVGLYFMHLRWDAPLNGFIIVVSLLFVTLFITFTLIDSGQYADTREAAAARTALP